jgi:hypothetical protein
MSFRTKRSRFLIGLTSGASSFFCGPCFTVLRKSVKPRIRNTVRHVEEPWLSQSEIKICTAGSHELGNCHVLRVSPNAAYRHFANREALLDEVGLAAADQIGVVMREAVADGATAASHLQTPLYEDVVKMTVMIRLAWLRRAMRLRH